VNHTSSNRYRRTSFSYLFKTFTNLPTKEFGIDIVGEDNKTIIHHKVAAPSSEQLAPQQLATPRPATAHPTRQPTIYFPSLPLRPSGVGGGRPPQSNGPGSFSFAAQGTAGRRPAMQAQGLGGVGGVGSGNVRAPGKSGLTFDHVLSRLQGELQKSCETGAELHNLTGAMNDIHDTHGGSLVSPTFPSLIYCLNSCCSPPIYLPYLSALTPRSTPPPKTPESAQQSTSPPAPVITELQTQLHDTKSSLASHVDKVRALEGVIAERHAIKREISLLRELVEKMTTTKISGDNENG
jgi:hypothetical protein